MKITRRGIFVDVIVVYDEVKHLKGRKLENMKKTKNKKTQGGLLIPCHDLLFFLGTFPKLWATKKK